MTFAWRPGREGLTLAELVVGLFVLTCAVLGLVAAEIYLARSEAGSHARQEASFAANNILNERLAQDFSADARRPKTRLRDGLSYALDEHLDATDLKTITVSIYFVDGAQWRQYDVSTCYSNAR